MRVHAQLFHTPIEHNFQPVAKKIIAMLLESASLTSHVEVPLVKDIELYNAKFQFLHHEEHVQ